MTLWLICCFIVMLFYIERKWLLWKIYSQTYPWSPNCLKNFHVSVILMKVSKCWNIAEFPKLLIKTENVETFYEDQTMSRLQEDVPPTTPDKSFLRRYTGIYRHLISQCFKDTDFGRLEMVQADVFSDTNEKHICWKIFKVFWDYIFCNNESVDIRKLSKILWAKLYCEMSDLLC